MSDEALSRALTDRIRSVPGVTGVYPSRPLVHAAAEAVASTFSLQEPDVLVDVQREGTTLRVHAGIAVEDTRPATETVREVGERVRDLVDERTGGPADLVAVTIRLVEDIGAPTDDATGPDPGERVPTAG